VCAPDCRRFFRLGRGRAPDALRQRPAHAGPSRSSSRTLRAARRLPHEGGVAGPIGRRQNGSFLAETEPL